MKGVYGKQEGAEKGYNPKKRGQKSYHPLLCFIAETRECLHNWFRSGSAYSANGCVEFMKECFARLPNQVGQINVRADSAFFSGELFDFLDPSPQFIINSMVLKLIRQQNWYAMQPVKQHQLSKHWDPGNLSCLVFELKFWMVTALKQ